MNKKWYILKVRGGKENNIIEELYKTLKKNDYKEKISIEFFKKSEEKNLIKGGYIFINCYLTPDLLKIIYSVPGVINFLNHNKRSENLPEPLPIQAENELLDLIKNKKNEINKLSKKEGKDFQINDLVEIIEGAFRGCQGQITKIDSKKGMITIDINFLGRLQPIEVSIKNCVEKAQG